MSVRARRPRPAAIDTVEKAERTPTSGAVKAEAPMSPVPPVPRDRSAEPTLREILPWHSLEERLQRVQAELAPGSGVRLADRVGPESPLLDGPAASNDAPVRVVPPPPPAIAALAEGAFEAEAVSFRVYTLAELDARRADADPALRMSRVMFDATPRPPTPWVGVRERARDLSFAVLGFVRTWATRRVRPPAAVLRAPFEEARGALLAALRTVDWKRVGTYGGASLATVLALLLVVLTVADLTDDLKPAHATREQQASALAIGATAAHAAAQRADALAAASVAPAAPAAAAADDVPTVFELGEDPAPAPSPTVAAHEAPPARARARRPRAAPRARGAKLSSRDASDVFWP